MKIQPLSTLYKQCRLPNVTKDIFGDPLTISNACDIIVNNQPVLVTNYNKVFKRPQPLQFYLTKERISNYLKQFNDQPYIKKAQEALNKFLTK